MKGLDSYYTPMPLADKLVSYVIEKDITKVIDFCVGDGVLLKAVRKRFGNVQLFGTDISDEVIDKIAKENTDWTLGVCDFRNSESVKELDFLKHEKFDLIMFNPPFTCKGSCIEHINIENKEFKVSTAMAFVMSALEFLSPQGGIYAILPISCVYSQKDRAAWHYLQTHYNACVLEEPTRVCFGDKCSPNIALVYMGNRTRQGYNTDLIADFSSLNIISVVRGCTRMQNPAYSNRKKALPLIHTTNIQEGEIVNLKRVLSGSQQTIDGYGVVIPRVCNPNPKKIALLDGRSQYVLSDCIIVLRTSSMEEAMIARKYIIDNWSLFVNLYKGTGAQYTTLERVRKLFIKN